MNHVPDFETFARLAQEATVVPVYRTILSDALTPVSAFLRVADSANAFLLESVVGQEKIARYSFLGADPFLTVTATGTEFVVESADGSRTVRQCSPFEGLREILSHYRGAHIDGLPRFCGGAVGYFAYDMVRLIENLPNAPQDDRNLPDLKVGLYDTMLLFDHIRKTVMVVCHAHVDRRNLRRCYDEACSRVDGMLEVLARPADSTVVDVAASGPVRMDFESTLDRDTYMQVVERCKEYIRAGDIFQVVPSQRLHVSTNADHFNIYRALRVVNPSPYMFFLKMADFSLAGSSPEVMVRQEGDTVTLRPIAGSRPRGATAEEDERLAGELLADPKERAEHVMLIDLGRNDLGRVCKYGTVVVDEKMIIERYSHVMHIVSNITGQLEGGRDAIDTLVATLPAGTVSGAPKVRAMEIIDEMEQTRRGPYAGAVGYIDFSGNMDTCITIRTVVLKGTDAYVQAGGGVVADSVPESEYEETLNKAKGLLRAIQVAEQFPPLQKQ